MNGLMKGFYGFTEWVTRLAYVNFLWVFFTLTGLVLFGFFPATVAMFAVVRKWVRKETDVPVFTLFWKTYKADFLKSNLLGLIISFAGFVLYFNFTVIEAAVVPAFKWLYIPYVMITVIYILTLLYIFPVFVHFNMKIKEVVKNAFILMAVSPLVTCSMVVLTGALCFLFLQFPGVIPFFSGSLIAILLMFLSNNLLQKISVAEG
ncbi:YesL family protein [Mesobacillus maritimus]|uniref:YesL family protein n=1 Tax=Mesobacillus maritimus TaxID=1643336 RepID=A0ABS7K8Z5_9BACI|nr:YesL family protein [Mesobacillus maritimus]MBY0098743.1 YesL family protein [Mesobacillus maritimus]